MAQRTIADSLRVVDQKNEAAIQTELEAAAAEQAAAEARARAELVAATARTRREAAVAEVTEARYNVARDLDKVGGTAVGINAQGRATLYEVIGVEPPASDYTATPIATIDAVVEESTEEPPVEEPVPPVEPAAQFRRRA